MDATIVYCSSNMEDERFEERIRKNILSVTDLPIISVSQKPIDFGKNICVGNKIGVTGFNFFRQVLIGCKEAKTDFIISAEADCLYPPDYFIFKPQEIDICYRDSNLYVIGDHRKVFWKKPEGATHAQIVGRQFYIDILEKLFENTPKWSAKEKNFPKERIGKEDVFDKINYWQSENPVVQIKTHRSMRYYTHSERIDIPEIPYWGRGDELREKMFEGIEEVYQKI